MIVVSRPLFRALLVAGLVASIFTGGCKKKPVATTPKQELPPRRPLNRPSRFPLIRLPSTRATHPR